MAWTPCWCLQRSRRITPGPCRCPVSLVHCTPGLPTPRPCLDCSPRSYRGRCLRPGHPAPRGVSCFSTPMMTLWLQEASPVAQRFGAEPCQAGCWKTASCRGVAPLCSTDVPSFASNQVLISMSRASPDAGSAMAFCVGVRYIHWRARPRRCFSAFPLSVK